MTETLLSTFKRRYLQWLAGPESNGWIRVNADAEVYLRKSVRVHHDTGRRMTTLDISSASSPRRYVGGIGAVLTWIETHNPQECTFVENVLHPRLAAYLVERRGYVQYVDPHARDGGPPSFYRLRGAA